MVPKLTWVGGHACDFFLTVKFSLPAAEAFLSHTHSLSAPSRMDGGHSPDPARRAPAGCAVRGTELCVLPEQLPSAGEPPAVSTRRLGVHLAGLHRKGLTNINIFVGVSLAFAIYIRGAEYDPKPYSLGPCTLARVVFFLVLLGACGVSDVHPREYSVLPGGRTVAGL
jgi:hypothetical protein